VSELISWIRALGKLSVVSAGMTGSFCVLAQSVNPEGYVVHGGQQVFNDNHNNYTNYFKCYVALDGRWRLEMDVQ
jgi:hypothetical protein